MPKDDVVNARLSPAVLPLEAVSLQSQVDAAWSDRIVSELMRYIAVPAKSPAFDPDWAEHGLLERVLQGAADWVSAQKVPALTLEVVRLDAFLSTRGIAHVDLLKLDVEGAELSALRGLGELLAPERTEVVQFEYGGTTLDAGNRLGDFFELLEARNSNSFCTCCRTGFPTPRRLPWRFCAAAIP